jgi:hypothetical protein
VGARLGVAARNPPARFWVKSFVEELPASERFGAIEHGQLVPHEVFIERRDLARHGVGVDHDHGHPRPPERLDGGEPV